MTSEPTADTFEALLAFERAERTRYREIHAGCMSMTDHQGLTSSRNQPLTIKYSSGDLSKRTKFFNESTLPQEQRETFHRYRARAQQSLNNLKGVGWRYMSEPDNVRLYIDSFYKPEIMGEGQEWPWANTGDPKLDRSREIGLILQTCMWAVEKRVKDFEDAGGVTGTGGVEGDMATKDQGSSWNLWGPVRQ